MERLYRFTCHQTLGEPPYTWTHDVVGTERASTYDEATLKAATSLGVERSNALEFTDGDEGWSFEVEANDVFFAAHVCPMCNGEGCVKCDKEGFLWGASPTSH
jgi:hypothetical protein